MSSADIFQNYFFQKILSGTLSKSQTVWIQIKPDKMSSKIDFFAIWVIFQHFFVVCRYFFKMNFFQKKISGTLSESQTVWIQIRLDILKGLIWVQNCLQRLCADNKIRHWQAKCSTIGPTHEILTTPCQG